MLKFALGNLLSRPLRSSLALTGLAIAIAGMVALFSIAQGIDYVVKRTFSQIPGIAVQQRGAPVPLFSTLPAAWGPELASIPGIDVVDAEIVQRLNVLEGKALISPPRFLVGFDLDARQRLRRDVYRENMKEGRYFRSDDAGTMRCLISRQIAQETGHTVGDSIRLNEYTAEIIGIYDTGSMLLDVNIVLDLDAVRQIMRIAPDTVSFFYAEPAIDVDQRALKTAIEQHFQKRKIHTSPAGSLSGLAPLASWLAGKLPGGSPAAAPEKPTQTTPDSDKVPGASPQPMPPESPVEVRLAEDWTERFKEFTGDLELFLMLITTMAVSIAMLSIVNTMTMSVSERMTEFGILRANGWSKWNVMQLMTLESGLLGIGGGLAGTLLGWIATQVVNSLWPDRITLHASPELLAGAVIISTLLGILGGLYPAWLAASRSPMDAIRRG